MYCWCIDVHIHSLEVLPGGNESSIQSLYLPVVRLSVRLTHIHYLYSAPITNARIELHQEIIQTGFHYLTQTSPATLCSQMFTITLPLLISSHTHFIFHLYLMIIVLPCL